MSDYPPSYTSDVGIRYGYTYKDGNYFPLACNTTGSLMSFLSIGMLQSHTSMKWDQGALSEFEEAVVEYVNYLLGEEDVLSDPAELENVSCLITDALQEKKAPKRVIEVFTEAIASRGDQSAATLLKALQVVYPSVKKASKRSLKKLSGAGIEPKLPACIFKLQAVEAQGGYIFEGLFLVKVRLQRPGDDRPQVASLLIQLNDEQAISLNNFIITPPLNTQDTDGFLEKGLGITDMDPVELDQVRSILINAIINMKKSGLTLSLKMAWPPPRNAPCWCGSDKKYKRCCGDVSASSLHPLEVTI